MKNIKNEIMIKNNDNFKFIFLMILILINIGLVFSSNYQFKKQQIYNEFIEKKISILTENPNDISVQIKEELNLKDRYFTTHMIYGENSKGLIDSIDKPNILTEDYKQQKIEQYQSWKNLNFSNYISYYYPTKRVIWEIEVDTYSFDIQSEIFTQ